MITAVQMNAGKRRTEEKFITDEKSGSELLFEKVRNANFVLSTTIVIVVLL